MDFSTFSNTFQFLRHSVHKLNLEDSLTTPPVLCLSFTKTGLNKKKARLLALSLKEEHL